MKWLAATTLAVPFVCIILVSCTPLNNKVTPESERSMGNNRIVELRLELAHALASSNTSTVSNEFRLKLQNSGNQPITLDWRLINPILLAKIQNSSTKLVAKMPPLIPRAAKKGDLLTLQPGEYREITFNIAEITMDDLKEPPYSFQCCYQSEGYSYPKEWNVWQGKAYSNTIRFGRGEESIGPVSPHPTNETANPKP